jgi:hypothetical protein
VKRKERLMLLERLLRGAMARQNSILASPIVVDSIHDGMNVFKSYFTVWYSQDPLLR